MDLGRYEWMVESSEAASRPEAKLLLECRVARLPGSTLCARLDFGTGGGLDSLGACVACDALMLMAMVENEAFTPSDWPQRLAASSSARGSTPFAPHMIR